MESKKNYLTKTLLCLALVMVLLSGAVMCGMGATASAATTGQDDVAEPYGLYTTLSANIGSTSTMVWASARNDFTLGVSTVEVYVYIYSSTTKESSCANMTLEARNHISDLNMNDTLKVYAPINGVGRYWRGLIEYKVDKKDWASKETGTYYYDANGNLA